MVGVLAGKKTFAFDWDGTLLDSMPIKWRTFSELLAETLRPLLADPPADLVGEVRSRYQALSGAPRREIVETILREHGLGADAVDFERFSRRLSQRNRRELASVEPFADAVDFMRRLVSTARAVYISSSVPQVELSALVEARLPAELVRRLAGVFGSDGPFTKGPVHIERILRETRSNRREVLFFGDDPADARLCTLAAVDCVLVDRRGYLASVDTGARRIPDFSALSDELSESSEVEQP